MNMKLLGLVLASGLVLCALAAPKTAESLTRRLRGYGETTATFDGESVTIKAESDEKAGLWAARYLHVNEKRVVKPGIVKLPNDTFTQVALKGKTVKITHSKTEPRSVLSAKLPVIPMYLNSWDDYCFRFYYWPGRSPAEWGMGPQGWDEYDPQAEFDFAKKNDNAGFVFWCDSQPNMWAKGLLDNELWNWGYKLARDRHLPIVLNTNFSVPFWYLNDHREENEQHAPDFIGSYHSVGEPGHAAPFLSWASSKGHREGLASWQRLVQDCNCDEVIELLEPHGELNHGDYTVFIEHGPLADKSFRTYLRDTYGTFEAVAKRWKDQSIRSWKDCRLPEIADFAGWGPNAIDLAGDWRGRPLESTAHPYPVMTRQDRQPSYKSASTEWVQPDADLSDWPYLYRNMPGSELGYMYEKRPAVIRRDIDLPAQKGRTWLYLWDLSQAVGNKVVVHVNGKKAGESGVQHASCHWMQCEVTDLLATGRNTIALELPHGVINYRIYLTHEEPKAYPYFPGGLNAKWVDFCGWQEWSRARAVETGLRTHRAVEPDKSIVAMAPATYYNSMRDLAMRYGSRFHDTGMTAACYWEYLPMLMRSAEMPFSVEPGGPAENLSSFRRYINLYLRCGVNAIHYFIHVGSIMWKDEIRGEFERLLPAIKMMGRMNSAPTEVAFLMDSRLETLMGYPWRSDPNSAFPSGYGEWRLNETLKDNFQIDAVTPNDVASGLAAKYRYLIDCNNTVMTPEIVDSIEKYVRDGGTFVAMFQSGRHTPETPDQWVLNRLTGCKVAESTVYHKQYNPWGVSTEPDKRTKVRRVADEKMGTSTDASLPWETWSDGTKLEVVDTDVETLYAWCDGENESPKSPAIVMRKLGKGRIVTFGVRARFYDAETRILGQILIALGAKRLPLVAPQSVHARHFITTDGTQDVWLLANEKWDGDSDYKFEFRDGVKRELTDVLTGKPVAPSGRMGPNGFVLATSPRADADQATSAAHWVKNQFGWWRGAEENVPAQLTALATHPDVVEIGHEKWKVTFADGMVSERPLEPWIAGRDIPEGVTDYTCEYDVTVPTDWIDSDVELWGVGQYAHSWNSHEFWVYLNDREIHYRDGGVKGRVLDLKPGETGRLRIVVKGDNHPRIRGFNGVTFLYRRPHPKGTFPLDGAWEVYTHVTDPQPHAATLPGRYENGIALRRTFTPPADLKGRRVDIDFTSRDDFLHGVIVNGKYLRRHHHRHGDRTVLNITPWLKPGEENEIWLVGNEFNNQPRSGNVTDVRLIWNK